MGKIYVTDIENPKAAFAYVGCFGFFAGEPEKELVINKPEGFAILTPQNEAWAKLIESFSNYCMLRINIKLFRRRTLSNLGRAEYEFCTIS